MYNRLTISLAFIGLLSACASSPHTTEHLASSMAAVRGAQEAGAQGVPQAALHLKLAEDQIAQAKNMMENGDSALADRMAIRAYNDAELANVIARNDAATKRLEAYRVNTSGGSAADPSLPTPNPARVQTEARVELQDKN